MARFIHDQFAKQYLSELLSSLGKVETSKDIAAEVRQVDVFFIPSSSPSISPDELGLLGRLTNTPAIFEPFRNPITANDIRTCMLKLFVLQGKWERENVNVKNSQLPQLWLLTPTASANLLDRVRAKPQKSWPQGIYFLGDILKTAIVVIHQLPRTSETLWLRLLGRGRVQQQAILELEALPKTDRWRNNVVKLVYELLIILAQRQKPLLDRDDLELIVTLTQMYEEAVAELREEAEKQATRRLITNILRVRFEEVDENLTAIIEAIASCPSEEFTPLLLQLSREELLIRFSREEEEENN
ncbi:MAG: hypothetical protein AAGA60_28200 [Cyanobacteria bacterium P01_E01_bin.42]